MYPVLYIAWSWMLHGLNAISSGQPRDLFYPVLHMRMVWKLRVGIYGPAAGPVGPNSNCGSSTDLNTEAREETGPEAATRLGPYCASASDIAIIESSTRAPMRSKYGTRPPKFGQNRSAPQTPSKNAIKYICKKGTFFGGIRMCCTLG
jgi:hypothetical protein